MSKKTRIIAAIAALAVVVGIAGYFAMKARGSGPEIETAKVSKQELAVTVTASGKVDAGVQSDVFPSSSGVLDEIYVKDGQRVKAGAKLAALDVGPLDLAVEQARAGLSQARSQLATIDQSKTTARDIEAAEASVDAAAEAYDAAQEAAAAVGDQAPSSTAIKAARAGVTAAKTAYENAKDAYDAYPADDATKASLKAAKEQAYAAYLSAKATLRGLEGADLSSAQAQANAGVEQAWAAYKSAKAQLARLQNSSTSAQRKAANDAVKQASKALSLAQKNRDEATLRAPIKGVVIFNAPGAGVPGGGSTSKLREGAAVSPAAAPFSVVDLKALKFIAEVDEADVNRVKAGMNVDVVLDAFPGETFVSKVVRLNPVAQATATGGTVFEVEVLLEDIDQDILIGMKGDATIKVSSQPGALTVPVEALFSEGGTDYVYVLGADNKLKKTEITVGATTDTEVEVVSGLTDGQTVALSGSTQYADGMSVRAKGQ